MADQREIVGHPEECLAASTATATVVRGRLSAGIYCTSMTDQSDRLPANTLMAERTAAFCMLSYPQSLLRGNRLSHGMNATRRSQYGQR
jgi:hypothetical protein